MIQPRLPITPSPPSPLPVPSLGSGRRESGEVRGPSEAPHLLTQPPISGLKGRLDYLSSLKVKGLVLGPLHKNQKDDVAQTDLLQIDPNFGSKEDFDSLLQSAKKKSGYLGVPKETARKDLARGKVG